MKRQISKDSHQCFNLMPEVEEHSSHVSPMETVGKKMEMTRGRTEKPFTPLACLHFEAQGLQQLENCTFTSKAQMGLSEVAGCSPLPAAKFLQLFGSEVLKTQLDRR